MKVYLGADHGGFKLKEILKPWLQDKGYKVEDFGASREDPGDDFVDYAFAVAAALQMNPQDRGILLCRNGVGVSVAANRFAQVRCALGFDIKQVTKARHDDNVNCLSLPADYISKTEAEKIVEAFLKTKASTAEKYLGRTSKLEQNDGCLGGSCCGGDCSQC